MSNNKMATGGEKDFSYPFTDTLSSPSSSSSRISFSESNSTEPTSSSEVDAKVVLDEGIYGWILHLIEEGKIARIVDRCNWIYELDWQDAVWKYWHEFREARRGGKSPLKKDNFNIRTASNGLRAALLNSYKDKGAKEYPEKKVMDEENKTSKRCFKLPSNVVDKLAGTAFASQAVSKVNETSSSNVTDFRETSESKSDAHGGENAINDSASHLSRPPPMASMDLNSLSVDPEESQVLINHILSHDGNLLNPDFGLTPIPSNDEELLPVLPDWANTSQYDAESSGYETGIDENLVKEMDPCEGPYQGGNMSFIFLEQPLSTRFPGVNSTSRCKVVFSSPKHRPMSPRVVHATVKNCYTLKVRVPRCPRIPGEQLVRGKLTVKVVVRTQEDAYIGETKYTYNSNLLRQFEQCVKALDNEDMELDCTGSPVENHVTMSLRERGFATDHQFNFATLRVLVFVGVKEKAYNVLLAVLKCPVISQVFQRHAHKLLPFLEQVQKREKQTDRSALVLEMSRKLLLECNGSNESLKQFKENARETTDKLIENGYEGGSELETQEVEVSFHDWNELSSSLKCREEKTENGKRFETREIFRDEENTSHTEVRDTPVHLTCSLSTEEDATIQSKDERKQDNEEISKPKIFVLRKPCSPVPISRSRSSFPDPRTDIFIELQVRNDQRTSEYSDNQDGTLDNVTEHVTEHVTVNKQLVTEHVSNTKHHVTVDVKHNGTKQTARDWEAKYVKRVSGKLGYWFRFYEPSCELLLMFTLYDKPHPTKSETKLKEAVLDYVTIEVETISWKLHSSRETRGEKEHDKRELALTPQVPLVAVSPSQTKVCIIMNELHELCDNGEWVKFEEACEMHQHSSNSDVKVAVLLEKAIAFLYHRDLEKAEATALEALRIVSEADNHQLLIGRAYYYLAHVYRRQKKHGEAVRCIDLSKQNLYLIDVCLDQSFMAYEEGNVMKEFISSGSILKKKLLLQAKHCFERCLDLSRRVDDSSNRVIPHTHSFALIKMAMLLLDCGSTSGRERRVSKEHVMEASKFLTLLQNNGLDDITERRKLQFLLARSDLDYRLSNYQAAASRAHQALEMAQEYGFLLEEMPARDRIYHNRQLLKKGGAYACPEI